MILVSSCSSYEPRYFVKDLSKSDSEKYKLDPEFYKKTTMVQGILIASSDKVSDHAHLETAYLFDMMMQNTKDDIVQRVKDNEVLCILVAWNELTSQVPQFRNKLTGKALDFYNWRSRGFLTKKHGRFTVFFAEEDVLEYEGGMRNESILIHEFGHVVHKAGFTKEQDEKLKKTFENSMNAKLWNDGRAAQRFRRVQSATPVSLLEALQKSFKDIPEELLKKCLDSGDILVNGEQKNASVKVTKADDVLIVFGGEKACYATRNRAEYFAEGFQIWFDTNRTMDHDHNHIETRDQLIKYDPYLSAFCMEVLKENEWKFESPRSRAGKEHLKGFDPANSPVVVDPEHIKLAAYDYYDNYWQEYWQRLADKHSIKLKEKKEK